MHTPPTPYYMATDEPRAGIRRVWHRALPAYGWPRPDSPYPSIFAKTECGQVLGIDRNDIRAVLPLGARPCKSCNRRR